MSLKSLAHAIRKLQKKDYIWISRAVPKNKKDTIEDWVIYKMKPVTEKNVLKELEKAFSNVTKKKKVQIWDCREDSKNKLIWVCKWKK